MLRLSAGFFRALALPLCAVPDSSVNLPEEPDASALDPEEPDGLGSPDSPDETDDGEACLAMGGQAVMDGIIIRNGDMYSLAVRLKDQRIAVERRPWKTVFRSSLARKPFVRGFPQLVETLINGVKALNRSAELAESDGAEALSSAQMALTLLAALALAVGLFVVAPHLLSIFMEFLGLGGAVEGLSFHLWDGFFKFAIFLGYIGAISLMPEIRAVFQYHGAEHKVIRAYEAGGEVSAQSAAPFSRLHPRCGTTFLLFVLSLAIVLHAVLVPPFLWLWNPQSAVAKHAGTLAFKVLLMAPISALAYEAIRWAARLGSVPGRLLRAPGLFLQALTTREPDAAQLEVAVAALREALGEKAGARVVPPAYTVLE